MPDSAPVELGGGAIPAWAVEAIVNAGRRLDTLGFVPATAGNISVRLEDGRIALTRSGGHKGFLSADNVMAVDLDGHPLTEGRPSAETGLHCQLYRLFPHTGAVLHGHSVAGTVLSMARPGPIRFTGYEVVKAFEGQTTHDTTVELPVFDNDQDIGRLAARVAPVLTRGESATVLPAYYIRGHGAYVWARDMARALTHMEALEFLLACELERTKL